MSFQPCENSDRQSFEAIVGAENVLSSAAEREKYSRDMTEDLTYLPELVLRPRNTGEVAEVLRHCNHRGIAVTPQGRRTCLSGGALPVYGGVALSLEHLNRILELDEDNYQVTVEPYVLNNDLRKAVEAKGLFYPPDPASLKICSIGGNLAEGSGGPKCVKYGTTKDYVLNLEVVLSSGEILWTGVNVLKNVMGYNLTQLFVGSEGTLGVITKAVLRLIPKPRHQKLLIASFSNLEDCSRAVNVILGEGIVPSALEFMERNALLAAQAYTGLSFPQVGPDTQAHLIVEFDGMEAEEVAAQALRTGQLLTERFASLEYLLSAKGQAEEDKIWRLRRSVLVAAKARSHCKEEDLVVPRSRLPEVLVLLGELRRKYMLEFVAWGHAGDGNLHVCVLQGSLSRGEFEAVSAPYLEELFHGVCTTLGGSVTGEHGVGLVQRQFMAQVLDPVALRLMRTVKQALDPRGILNPGKMFLDGGSDRPNQAGGVHVVRS